MRQTLTIHVIAVTDLVVVLIVFVVHCIMHTLQARVIPTGPLISVYILRICFSFMYPNVLAGRLRIIPRPANEDTFQTFERLEYIFRRCCMLTKISSFVIQNYEAYLRRCLLQTYLDSCPFVNILALLILGEIYHFDRWLNRMTMAIYHVPLCMYLTLHIHSNRTVPERGILRMIYVVKSSSDKEWHSK